MTFSSGDWFVLGIAVGFVPMTHLWVNRNDSWWCLYNALWAIKLGKEPESRELATMAIKSVGAGIGKTKTYSRQAKNED